MQADVKFCQYVSFVFIYKVSVFGGFLLFSNA